MLVKIDRKLANSWRVGNSACKYSRPDTWPALIAGLATATDISLRCLVILIKVFGGIMGEWKRGSEWTNVIQTHVESFVKQIKTCSSILFSPFYITICNARKRNGVAVVGGSNPLAPTNFLKLFLLFAKEESKNIIRKLCGNWNRISRFTKSLGAILIIGA